MTTSPVVTDDPQPVVVYAIGDDNPSARVNMTGQQIDALVDKLRNPNGVLTIVDSATSRTTIIPVRSVGRVFVGRAC
jgi:hypothetical protein